jgi:hypothetical protein
MHARAKATRPHLGQDNRPYASCNFRQGTKTAFLLLRWRNRGEWLEKNVTLFGIVIYPRLRGVAWQTTVLFQGVLT